MPRSKAVVATCGQPFCLAAEHLEVLDRRAVAERVLPSVVRNRSKTHCPKGHPLTGKNVYRWRRQRHCRRCHRERERERYVPKPAETKTCEECGGEFETKLAARYCSNRCSSKAWRRPRSKAEQRSCQECGRVFTSSRQAKFCSSACNARAWRKARKAAA